MRITKTVVAAGAAAALAVAGLGMAVSAPFAAAASATVDSAGQKVGDRLQTIKDALSGLVKDGTITQGQADKVAKTLNDSEALRPHGPGGHHGLGRVDLDAAAKVLGMTQEQLRQALEADGATLATLAQQHGVEKSALVDALVTAGKQRVEQAVTDGRLTRARADELIAALPQRVEAAVDEGFSGHRGRGRRDGRFGDDDGSGGSGTAPQTPSPSATTPSATTESSSLTT
ncbi:MAG: hypothetical protein ACLGIA_04125 [Actinomycetes bacterium]